MAETKMESIGDLQKGSYIVIDGAPCKVVSTATSKPGKHGHAKVNLMAVGMLDDKKRNLVAPGHENVEVPIIEKKNAQVLSINGSMANVMDATTFETFDLAIADELKAEIKEGATVVYWEIMTTRVMKQIKNE